MEARGMRAATVIAGLCAAVVIGNAPAIIAEEARAETTCDHRGFDHIKRHGGKLADDYYHIGHHEPVTCDDQDDGKTPSDDDPNEERHHQIDPKDDPLVPKDEDKHKGKGTDIPRNDTPGFGCHLTRCG